MLIDFINYSITLRQIRLLGSLSVSSFVISWLGSSESSLHALRHKDSIVVSEEETPYSHLEASEEMSTWDVPKVHVCDPRLGNALHVNSHYLFCFNLKIIFLSNLFSSKINYFIKQLMLSDIIHFILYRKNQINYLNFQIEIS